MRKFSLLTFLLLFSVFICLGAGTALASNGDIQSASVDVNLTNQNPDYARPGEPVELTLSVQNVGKTNLEGITVTVNSEYPFNKVSGEELTKKVSYLNARQDDEDAAVLKFKLMTDANASAGKYDIDITTAAKESGDSSKTITTTKTIQLEIKGKEYAQVVTVSKANIDIAKEEPLELIVTNTGTSPIKNMVVSWKDPKGVILPVYSDNTKYIKYLEAGGSVNISYSVMADVNADPGLYTLDVNLSYEDYESKEQSTNTTAGLFVGGETDFDVSFSESDQGEVSLSVANVGNNMAYSVKVSVPDQEGYRVSGSSSTIVGNLEKGDYTIASFNIVSTQEDGKSADSSSNVKLDDNNVTSMDSNPLKVQIEYTDAKGERITVDKEVKLEMTAGNMTEASQGGPGGQSKGAGIGSYLLYVVIIALVGGSFVYRRKIQEKIQERKGKPSGSEKSENQ
ncbi:COG1361 S-layer family protein [Methanosarcina sp. UBA411]|uniref:COG1361 S-layer family protein n=1 Tax=Methanosarcina sp. UBA411 TaxID=1915589 RepID=UPI0025E7DF07|nr:COG1361 S-layer family protein [Methanosarcina sp. UBA411]